MNESSRFNRAATISSMEIARQKGRREATLRDYRMVDVSIHVEVTL